MSATPTSVPEEASRTGAPSLRSQMPAILVEAASEEQLLELDRQLVEFYDEFLEDFEAGTLGGDAQ